MINWRGTTVGLSCILLTGCADDASRYDIGRDSISTSFGEAVRHNEAVQVIDPWPKYARNTDIQVTGARLSRAVQRERCGTELQQIPGTSQTQSTTTGQASVSNNSASSTSSTSSFTGPAMKEVVPDC